MALSTGSLLAGRYEITAPVAVGGMGEVWRARDPSLDRVVAAKVLKSEFTGDPNFLARFRNEARHTAALSHPNIASVYDYGETLDENGTTVAYLVMEFVEGQPLVRSSTRRAGCRWTGRCTSSRQAAEGLSAAHRAGVVHRDIKPGNIMVRPDGVVKLTDFGIAQARDAVAAHPHRHGRRHRAVPLPRAGPGHRGRRRPPTSTPSAWSATSAWPASGPFDGASQVAIALAHITRPAAPAAGGRAARPCGP